MLKSPEKFGTGTHKVWAERERERQRERQRERETETERHTERQTDRDRETDTQRDGPEWRERERERVRDRETDTERQTQRETELSGGGGNARPICGEIEVLFHSTTHSIHRHLPPVPAPDELRGVIPHIQHIRNRSRSPSSSFSLSL